MNQHFKRLTKSKTTPPDGYAAIYNYKSSFGMQKITIKYLDDAKAIDILLNLKMERQALLIAEFPENKLK